MKLYRDFFKRGIDVTVSGCALLVLAVPLAAVAVWLHFANKGAGTFFLQERPGKVFGIPYREKLYETLVTREEKGMAIDFWVLKLVSVQAQIKE